MPTDLRNIARSLRCRSERCKPSDDTLAAVSLKLGRSGKAKHPGFEPLMNLVKTMKESNVWGKRIRGYFFKGSVPTKTKSEIESYTRAAGWKSKTTPMTQKTGVLWRDGGKKYLLIFAKYRGQGNKVYCSLTIV